MHILICIYRGGEPGALKKHLHEFHQKECLALSLKNNTLHPSNTASLLQWNFMKFYLARDKF